ncbi:MAG: VWA domain-containing protein [Legionellaceae bacterium]|nr:VWA domain-containing protein [Legionellaceae bacterium]
MFQIANPWIFIFLPLPWLVRRFFPALSLPVALWVPFYEGLPLTKQQEQRYALWWLWAVWCLCIAAAAGPRWLGAPTSPPQEGRNIMLVLDLSASMGLADLEMQGHAVPRIEGVKVAAADFVQERPMDRIGLILFGTRAYLQTPLTHDHAHVLKRLDDATVGLAGRTTSIGDALGLAIKRLQNVPHQGRVIILLTDGANNSGMLSPKQAAKLAHQDGIKVYTIGLGPGDMRQDLQQFLVAMNGASDLDEPTLKLIANTTGGRYFRATDKASLSKIYNMINQMEAVQQPETPFILEQEYYPWLLAAAILISVIALWRRRQSYA